jgi:hypothetical protein
MGPVVILIVLPFAKFVVEQVDIIADAVLVEELVKLLLVDAVRTFDLAIQTWCFRTDVDVADDMFLQVPVEVGLELGAVIRLITSTLKGSRRMTSSTKLMAAFWLQTS